MAVHAATLRLHDIIDAIARIRSETEGVALDAIEADWRKRWLVERGIEIISEASRHLPADIDGQCLLHAPTVSAFRSASHRGSLWGQTSSRIPQGVFAQSLARATP